MGCQFFLQGIFPTPGSNSCLLHWQAGSLPLSHQGIPLVILQLVYFTYVLKFIHAAACFRMAFFFKAEKSREFYFLTWVVVTLAVTLVFFFFYSYF